MCGGGPAWKREIVPDHKFDFVDTREFTDNSFGMRFKYLMVYVFVLKDFLIYVADIFSAITMLTSDGWSIDIFEKCGKDCISLSFDVGKWLFVGCIIFSFLLLAYETRKSKKIIASRDISYAFTNLMAQNYYSLRSYDHFCFFDHISNSTKKKDDFAFFVFFTFKSKSLYTLRRWKHLCLADGPRQAINGLTLYAIFTVGKKDTTKDWYDITKYFSGNNMSTKLLTGTMAFTVLVFAVSMLILILAAIFYVPLLCYIRGNLKEYVCHKIDKRIDAVIKRRNKERLAKAAIQAKKEAQGDFSHLKNKKGHLVAQPLPQPTLPNLSVDDDDLNDGGSTYTRGPPQSNYPASTYTHQGEFYAASDHKTAPRSEYNMGSEYNLPINADYPPMPAYNPYSTHQAPGTYANFNPSQATFNHDDSYSQNGHVGGRNQMYDDDPNDNYYDSGAAGYPKASLAGGNNNNNHISYQSDGGSGYVADAHDVYGGYGGNNQTGNGMGGANAAHMRRSPAPFAAYAVNAEPAPSHLAYDQGQDYPSPHSAGPPPPSFSQAQQQAYNRNGPGGYAV